MCSLPSQKPKLTPVIFHTLAGYDFHLFVKNLGKAEGRIKCIPYNEENYISFSEDVDVGALINKDGKEVDIENELRFIDGFKSMASSIEKLVSNLSLAKLKETEKVFKDKIELVSIKGVYPYDYMDCITKFDERELPLKGKFHSKLNDCDTSDEDYKHAKNVWNEFRKL